MKNDDQKKYLMNSPILDGLAGGAGWGIFFLIAALIAIAVFSS